MDSSAEQDTHSTGELACEAGSAEAESENSCPYYITTPIYYVNDTPHIGHAYTTLACDVLARHYRSRGRKVHFLTGTDEHGQKVEKAALANGVSPEDLTDRVSRNFFDLAKKFCISNNDFIRTTEERHHRSVKAFWEKIAQSGDIYLGTYSGWYAVRDEAYYDESEISTNEEGRKVAPSGALVDWVEEPSYFFRLSRWQQTLLDYYDQNPEALQPEERRNEVLSFIRSGLQDLSVSRTTFNWGIRVPDNPGHVIYVWMDALTNYITALGYPDQDKDLMQEFWPANLHVVGKDIVRFHAVYWPAFLLSAGLQPPQRIFAHGWWTNEGEKISKTLGNTVDPFQLIDEYGLDQVRYFLMREVPFGQDGDFSRQSVVTRVNHDLANDYGNLCQRVLSMVQRNTGGAVPTHGEDHPDDTNLLSLISDVRTHVERDIDAQRLHVVLQHIWRGFAAANAYIDHQAPWALKKTDPARMEAVLYILLEAIRRLTVLVAPFLPNASEAVFRMLAVPDSGQVLTGFFEKLAPGTPLPAPNPLFPRIDSDSVAADSAPESSS